MLSCVGNRDPKIIGAVPGIQHGESRVTTVVLYSPNVAMSITTSTMPEVVIITLLPCTLPGVVIIA